MPVMRPAPAYGGEGKKGGAERCERGVGGPAEGAERGGGAVGRSHRSQKHTYTRAHTCTHLEEFVTHVFRDLEVHVLEHGGDNLLLKGRQMLRDLAVHLVVLLPQLCIWQEGGSGGPLLARARGRELRAENSPGPVTNTFFKHSVLPSSKRAECLRAPPCGLLTERKVPSCQNRLLAPAAHPLMPVFFAVSRETNLGLS